MAQITNGSLRPRMMLPVEPLESLPGNMGVDLGGWRAIKTEEFLDGSDVVPIFEKVGCE